MQWIQHFISFNNFCRHIVSLNMHYQLRDLFTIGVGHLIIFKSSNKTFKAIFAFTVYYFIIEKASTCQLKLKFFGICCNRLIASNPNSNFYI